MNGKRATSCVIGARAAARLGEMTTVARERTRPPAWGRWPRRRQCEGPDRRGATRVA
jgi:hypothetical protein